jgi:phage gp29-like protein
MADETNPLVTQTPQTVFNGLKKADHDPEGKPQPVIIQELTVRPANRNPTELGRWRNIIRSAEALIPRRIELYDLYTDILLDGVLHSLVEKRLMAVTNVEWQYLDKDGKEVDFMMKWIDTPDFELTVKEILNSKLWGYTMLEFDFTSAGLGVYLIPRKHMRPDQGLVSGQQTGNNGINIREGIFADTVLEAGDPKDLGLLIVAAMYVIIKRGNWQDWIQFAEIFGQPLIDAVWNGFDEEQKKLLEDAVENMGGGGKIVRPEGTSLQFIQGGGNNPNGDLYNNLRIACNDEMTILMLGQTETTQSSASSGYAQASVHADTMSDININDQNFVRRILNRRLIKMLQAHGFDMKGGSFSIKKVDDEIALKDRLEMDIQLKTVGGVPISDDYFYEKYGIEKPANYDAMKAAMVTVPPPDPGGGLNMALLMQLKESGFFRKAPKAIGAKTISLADFYSPANCCDVCGGHQDHKMIKLSDDGDIDKDFIKKVFNGELKPDEIDHTLYFKTAEKLSQGVAEGIGSSKGFKQRDVMDTKTQLYDKMKNNVYAFSGAKSLYMLQQYASKLTDENGDVRSFAGFRNAVIPVGQEFNENYLKTEYNSAVSMAQTAGDNKVRPKHKLLDGTILPPTDVLWSKIYPPNDWNCRCTVIPAPGAVQTNRDDAKLFSQSSALPAYFSRNVGTEQVVFNDAHPYFARASHDLKKGDTHQFLAVENYGMRTPENIMTDSNLPDFTPPATKADAELQWSTAPKTVQTADGLQWNMNNEWKHVVNDHPDEDRWKYINKAHDVMANADEVWSSREKGKDGQYHIMKRYVKYYAGKPMVFSYDVNHPSQWTMYQADIDSTGTYTKLRSNIRKGVLLHRK